MSPDIEELKSRSLSVEGIDQRLLFGQNGVFLRIIETRFNASILARGDKIVVEGPGREVDQIIRLIGDLITRIKQGDFITDQYLNYAIAMVKENGEGPAQSISTEALLTSSLKKVIKPKTIGQTRYVEAVDKNDIVFVVDPIEDEISKFQEVLVKGVGLGYAHTATIASNRLKHELNGAESSMLRRTMKRSV